MSNFDLSDNIRIKENLLIQNIGSIGRETVITLDSGDINKSGALKMENLKKVHDGSTGNIELGYCLNSIVATNIEYGFEKGKKYKNISNIPLNLNLYSTSAKGFESENRESIKAIDEVTKIIRNTGVWVMDRGYDRSKNIIRELVDRRLAFIIRAVGTRDVIRMSDSKKMRLKHLADGIKVRKRIMNFEYQNDTKNTSKERSKKKISGMVGYEKIRIPGIDHDLWGVENTYKYMKQEFYLESIMLKNYRSLENMIIFLLSAMNFVSHISKNVGKYFCDFLIFEARALHEKKLKYKEHSVIAGIREVLALSHIGIRTFLRKKIDKFGPGLQVQLFDEIENPYKNLGKL